MHRLPVEGITITVDRDLEDLVDSFIKNRKKEVTAIEAAIAIDDFAAIDQVCHDLIGSGVTFGFNFVTYLGRDIRQAASAGDKQQVMVLVKELKTAFDNLTIQFEDIEQ